MTNVHVGPGEVDRGPFEVANFGCSEAVAISDQDHRRVALAVAVAFGGLDQLGDFGRCEVFTLPILSIEPAYRRDCS